MPPGIVIFSLVIGVILNNKFFGRTFARAVFFLPVIVTSGVVISIIQGDAMSSVVLSGSKGGSMVQAFGLTNFMYSLNLPVDIINFISKFTNQMFNFAWKSGVQILLFIGALQTISHDLYEASSIEGATAWDDFWKRPYENLCKVMDTPIREGYPYVEPNDFDSIMKEAIKAPEMKPLSDEEYKKRLYGAFFGRCAAVILGKPLEMGLTKQFIKEYLESVGE